ncbi:uncharacterized protein isoform X4 [Danio rerio]
MEVCQSAVENPPVQDSEQAEVQTAMLWSIQEAVQRQTLQIGVSACGATAVVDVLQALGISVSPETVNHCVRTSLRRNEAPLHDYLHSRSTAGQVHQMISEEAQADDVRQKTPHLLIPAAYSSGVTFFALRDSAVGQELLSTPDLPPL